MKFMAITPCYSCFASFSGTATGKFVKSSLNFDYQDEIHLFYSKLHVFHSFQLDGFSGKVTGKFLKNSSNFGFQDEIRRY